MPQLYEVARVDPVCDRRKASVKVVKLVPNRRTATPDICSCEPLLDTVPSISEANTTEAIIIPIKTAKLDLIIFLSMFCLDC